MDVELSNPLHAELAVTRLRLACTWEGPAPGRAGSPEGSSTTAAGGGAGEAGGQPNGQAQGPGFRVHEESVTLRGGERVVAHLVVVPLRPGTLRVEGVAWLLNGAAHGKAALAIPQPRPRKPGSSSR